MLWGDGDGIQNPVGSTYDGQIESSVKDQLKNEESLLRHYSRLIAVRHKYPAIARGNYNVVTSENDQFGGYYIEYNGEIIGLFHNSSDQPIVVNLSALDGLDGYSFSRLCDFVGVGSASLDGDLLIIDGQTSVILGK